MIDGQRGVGVGITAVAGWPEPYPGPSHALRRRAPGSYDARARLAYMDELGIWAQVLYPNVAGFGSQRFLCMPRRRAEARVRARVQRLPARLGVGRRRAA